MTAPQGSQGRVRAGWHDGYLGVVLIGFVLVGSWMILLGSPLGHDESVYAQRGLYYATGGEPTLGYWNDYRAPGLPLLMSVVLKASATDLAARAVPLLLAITGLLLTWWWARMVFDDNRVGILAALFLALMPGYMQFSWQISVDIPSAVLGLAAACVLLAASTGKRVRWWAVAVIPLAVAATMARFGAPALLAPALSGVALYRWPATRRSLPLVTFIALAAGAASSAVLLTPQITGAVQAPLTSFGERELAKEIPVWSSVVDHLRVGPTILGPILVVVVPLAIVGLVLQVRRGRQTWPPILLNAGIVLGFFVLLNLSLAQGFAQYLIPMLPFLATLAAALLVPLIQGPRAVVIASSLIVVAAGWAVYDSYATSKTLTKNYSIIRVGAEEIGSLAEGECLLLTGYSPQVGWYSGCAAASYPRSSYNGEGHQDELFEDIVSHLEPHSEDLPSDADVYAVLVERGKRQPLGSTLGQLVAAVPTPTVEVGDQKDGSRQHIEFLSIGNTDALTAIEDLDLAEDE